MQILLLKKDFLKEFEKSILIETLRPPPEKPI